MQEKMSLAIMTWHEMTVSIKPRCKTTVYDHLGIPQHDTRLRSLEDRLIHIYS